MTVTSKQPMKMLKPLTAIALTVAYLASPLAIFAQEKKDTEKKDTAKPYPLETCIVSDEKLGGHGEPYVFNLEGQQIKLCCKSCEKDFKKEPAKYLKKLEAAAKADKK